MTNVAREIKYKRKRPFNVEGKKYMPLKLKMVLAKHNLRQADWQDAIVQSKGRSLSSSAGTSLLNWNTWPKLTPQKTIVDQTVEFLRDCNVPEGEIASIWEIDKEDLGRDIHPVNVHKDVRSARNRSPFESQLPETEMLSQSAKRHFALFKDPFIEDVQSADDVFLSGDQRYIREAMFHTARHGGFIAVIGESGAGKTTLRRDLLDRIEREQMEVTVIQPRIIDKGKLTAGAICDAIIGDISSETLKQTLEGKARQIERLLTGSSRAGNSHVLIIEEAHDLTIKVLKYLKRFYELEDGFKKLLSIILVGQPELKDKLDERQNWDAREVIRRIEVAELQPLNGNLEEYIQLKLKRVDKSLNDVFEKEAFEAMRDRLVIRRRGGAESAISMMYPLVVNNAITKAMNLAAEIGAPRINAEIIKEV